MAVADFSPGLASSLSVSLGRASPDLRMRLWLWLTPPRGWRLLSVCLSFFLFVSVSLCLSPGFQEVHRGNHRWVFPKLETAHTVLSFIYFFSFLFHE